MTLLAQGRADEISDCGTCHSVFFDTSNTPQPFRPKIIPEEMRPIFKRGVQVFEERVLVQSALAYGENLGLERRQAERLRPVFENAYRQIAADSEMEEIQSVLPFCFDDQKQKRGHYFLYSPKNRQASTETIVFLHGFGGNLKFYLSTLKSQYPDFNIILPTWGASWASGNGRYIREVLHDAERRFDLKVRTAHLMSISAGGGVSFEIFRAHEDLYADLAVFTSCPWRRTVTQIGTDSKKILMINGVSDRRFPLDRVKATVTKLSSRSNFSLVEIPADHFLFLTHTTEWKKAVTHHLSY